MTKPSETDVRNLSEEQLRELSNGDPSNPHAEAAAELKRREDNTDIGQGCLGIVWGLLR